MRREVLVLGAGPAGTALAAALTGRGRDVALVDPAPDRPWPNRYGAWADELDALGLSSAAARRWPRSEVVLPDGRPLDLGRGYVAVDGERLRERLSADLAPPRRGRVVGLDHHTAGTTARLDDGAELEARVVVDATGHGSPFVLRDGAPTAWQVAWGAEHTLRTDWPDDAMRLMDWRTHGPHDDDPRPTFLYAQPLGDGRWFVEETLLIGEPPMALDVLQRRLDARLGCGLGGAHVERCCFPMDPPLPRLDQPVLGFGAAASLVHPATGYLLARTLRAAPGVADALTEGLTAGRPPRDVVRDAWRALWPPELCDAARLLRFGAHALLAMDREQLGAFYEAFFAIPAPDWRTYLAGDAPAGEIARVMLAVFGAASPATRLALARRGMADPWPLLRGIARRWI